MAFQIFGIDNEFAAATGSNVDTSPGKSRFDNPPNGSKDLIITTKDGDPDPRLFEIGDTYEVSWGGSGGGGTILNAVVVRSDPAPGGGGIIVFDGVDENGDPAQIIWTPGLDLEGWYSDNYNPSAEPEFFTTDQDAAYTHSFVCFADTTRIRTPQGEREAGLLQAGDLVTTLDGGDVPLLWTARWTGAGTADAAPVCFAPFSIGNRYALHLSQQHRVLVSSPRLQLLFGLEEALAPARAFVNGHSIRLSECQEITYVHLMLPTHHILEAEGALCESLYLGDESSRRLLRQHDMAPFIARTQRQTPARPFLSMKEARLLLHERCLAPFAFDRVG